MQYFSLLQDPSDDWTEHISSSGKKYYYNCRTEVSQWEKPKDLLDRQVFLSSVTEKGVFFSRHPCRVTYVEFECNWSYVANILLQGTEAERLGQ